MYAIKITVWQLYSEDKETHFFNGLYLTEKEATDKAMELCKEKIHLAEMLGANNRAVVKEGTKEFDFSIELESNPGHPFVAYKVVELGEKETDFSIYRRIEKQNLLNELCCLGYDVDKLSERKKGQLFSKFEELLGDNDLYGVIYSDCACTAAKHLGLEEKQ